MRRIFAALRFQPHALHQPLVLCLQFHQGLSRAERRNDLARLAPAERLEIVETQLKRLAPHSPWLYDALRFYVEFHKQHEGLDGAVINDVLAIAYLLQPEVLTFSDLRLVVDLDDGQSRGRTKLNPKGSFTRVAMEVHPPPVRRLLFERVLAGALVEEAMA